MRRMGMHPAAAGRWRFLLKTSIGVFLDSPAFPILLLLVTPLVVIVARRWKLAPPESPARFQCSLWSLLMLTALVAGFIGVALLSVSGAYSLAMVGAFYLMLAEVVRGGANQKLSLGLLGASLVFVPLNLAVYFAVAVLADPFLLFNPVFVIAVAFVGPALATAGAIVAAIIGRRAGMRVPALSLLGFCIWMAGIGFGNFWLIGEIAGGCVAVPEHLDELAPKYLAQVPVDFLVHDW